MKTISTREHLEVRAYIKTMGHDLRKRAAFAEILVDNLDADWSALVQQFEQAWAVQQALQQPKNPFSQTQTINFQIQTDQADEVIKGWGEAMALQLDAAIERIGRGGG